MAELGKERGRSIRNVIDVLASVAMITVSGIIGWSYLSKGGPEPPVVKSKTVIPSAPMSIEGMPAMGLSSAPVVLVTFSDFQCSYCEQFARITLPLIEERYVRKGTVQAVFRHMPLPIHGAAKPAAEAAACAARQGHFWQVHDRFFEIGRQLDLRSIDAVITGEKLDSTAYEKCMTTDGPRIVQADSEAGQGLKMSGTPTSLVGQRRPDGTVQIFTAVDGARPIEVFSAALDNLIAQSSAGSRRTP